MEILTLKSKVKLGCNRCDRCCVYRGDIRLVPTTVCRIAKHLKMPIKEFLEKYADRIDIKEPEYVFKTVGEIRKCILYSDEIKGCTINSVKPMQCIMFPLVPENLKRDYFWDNGQCNYIPEKETTVNEWLNGNNKLYKRNKKIYMLWIKFLEWIQTKWHNLNKEQKDKIYEMLFLDYNCKLRNIKRQFIKNLYKVEKYIKQIEKEKNNGTHNESK